MSEQIINPRPPTESDLAILAYMDAGNTMDAAKALGQFKITGIGDVIYRLRKAGHVILGKWKEYDAKDGKRKRFMIWYTKEEIIMKAGAKTEQMLKGKGIEAHTRKIEEISKNVKVVQPELFTSADSCRV